MKLHEYPHVNRELKDLSRREQMESTWDHIGDVNEMGFLTPEQNETLLVERTVVYKYDEITGRPIVSSYHTQG